LCGGGRYKNVFTYNKPKNNNNQVIITTGKHQQLLNIRERSGKGANKSKGNLVHICRRLGSNTVVVISVGMSCF
jgi:hypothetical protein